MWGSSLWPRCFVVLYLPVQRDGGSLSAPARVSGRGKSEHRRTRRHVTFGIHVGSTFQGVLTESATENIPPGCERKLEVR